MSDVQLLGAALTAAATTTSVAAATGATCPAGHTLASFQTPRPGFGCDLCKSSMSIGSPMFGCRVCDYDLCSSCYSGALGPSSYTVGEEVVFTVSSSGADFSGTKPSGSTLSFSKGGKAKIHSIHGKFFKDARWKFIVPFSAVKKVSPATGAAAGGRRTRVAPTVGDNVVLMPDFASYGDAKSGPLTPGVAGKLIEDDGTSKPYRVKTTDGRTWWYKAKAITRE